MSNGTTTYMRSSVIGMASIHQRGGISNGSIAGTSTAAPAPVPRSPGFGTSKTLKARVGGVVGPPITGAGNSNVMSNRRVVNHLYMAPLASIRNSNDPPAKGFSAGLVASSISSNGNMQKCAGYTEKGTDPSSLARRRRGSHRGGTDDLSSLERQGSNRSITDEFLMGDRRLEHGGKVGAKKDLPRPPRLWGDVDKNDSDDDLGGVGRDEESSSIAALHNSSPELLQNHRHDGIDYSPLRPRRRWMQGSSSNHSDRQLDESNQGVKPSSSCLYRSSVKTRRAGDHGDTIESKLGSAPASARVLAIRSFTSATNMIQLLVLLVLAVFVYDSHHKVKSHKFRLREYDEERSHMLDQMMWIDQAAKKVHTRYSSLLQKDPSLETREELLDEAKYLRDELDRIQVRIQLNSRDRIHQLFGNKPLHISFKFSSSTSSAASVDNLVAAALSDDAPHAVATLLTQVDGRLWDDVEYEAVETGVVQISSTLATSTPLLEFVERSRGCHEVGSIALRSVVKDELTSIVLRVHLIEKAPMSEKDVCIGRLLSGLDHLNQVSRPERR